MGFCSPNDYLEFMRQCPDLERMLVRSGIKLFKFWFSVTREEQLRRFQSRENDPLKQWKLPPIDKASLDKWDDYTEAKEAMFFYTGTADAPWTIIKSDDKKRARLNCMQYVLSSVPYPNKNWKLVTGPDPLIVGTSAHVIGRDDHILGKTLRPGNGKRQAAPLPLKKREKTATQSSNGSFIRIVSSRSGLVESSATGHSISSSRYFTYLMAWAGSCAQLRAPAVVPFQPSKLS